MSALEQAEAVLRLSSNSFKPEQLPCPPSDLVRLWCGRLAEEDCQSDEKEVLLRALRSCRFTVAHDVVISSCLPVLLDSSPSLRLHAASSILQYISTSNSILATEKAPLLVATIVRALAPLPYQLPTASSALHRFVSTSFRILSACISKASTLSPDVATSVAQLLGLWVYHGLQPVAGAASPLAAARGRVAAQGQLAFGVMSAFMQPPPSPRKRRDSTASSASSRASFVSRLGEASDSENEGGTFDRRRYLAEIRLDALSCLRALASRSPKAVYKHWGLFLADSPYLRHRQTLFSIIESDPSRTNRLQACYTLEAMLSDSAAYLNIAEDRSTKASFTSLSAKLGDTLSELHSSLATLLSRPIVATQADVHLALLSLASTLAANCPYGRLRNPLASQLAKPCLSLLGSLDSKVVSAAAAALASVVARYVATSSAASFEWEQLVRAVEPLLAQEAADDCRRAAWDLLAATVPANPVDDWTFATGPFETNFASAAVAVQEAQASFVVALSRSLSTTHIPYLDAIVKLALASPHDTVRAVACAALTSPLLASSPPSHVQDEARSPWRRACLLASQDPSDTVRAAAIRVLGLLAKSAPPPTTADLQDAIPTLLSALRAECGSVTEGGRERLAGAMWTLANCCDALVNTNVVLLGHDRDEVLQAVLNVFERDAAVEQTLTSAFRIIASLTGATSADATGSVELSKRAAEAAIAGLAHPAAKVRWNAAIASAALLPRIQDNSLSHALLDTVLADSSYKVRIHASSALLSSAASPTRLPQDALSRLRPSLDGLATDVADGRVPPKEKQHADQLRKRLAALCARVETA